MYIYHKRYPQAKGTQTLLLNEGILRALKGKKLRLKNPMLLHSIFDEMKTTIEGQFLERIPSNLKLPNLLSILGNFNSMHVSCRTILDYFSVAKVVARFKYLT